jgi:hypothetical protein
MVGTYPRGNRMELASSLAVLSALMSTLLLFEGCAGTGRAGMRVTLTQYERLRDLEAELPISPDSIAARYQRFDSTAFRILYQDELDATCGLIDSLNGQFPDSLRIDTLSIDHSVGNFGEAARRKSTLFLSSSFIIIFDDRRVVRSVVFHEFGHLRYEGCSLRARLEIDSIWNYLQRGSLLYLLHDGEYSGNARFGGHPNDSPSEMFASTFNLINNGIDEMQARLRYVDPRHLAVIQRLLEIVRPSAAAIP